MSEVRVVVREAGHDWSGTMHGSSADRAIAALSADPITLAELDTACARFAKPSAKRPFFANLSAGLRDDPHDAGIVIIDLVARLVVVDSTYSSPGSSGEVCYHDGQCATDTWLPYHLAKDWLLTSDCCQWPAVAEQRRREKAAAPPLDARKVFYGHPLLEFVARETFAAHARRETIAAAVRARWAEDARRRLAKADNLSPDDVDPRRLTDEDPAPRTWPGQERYASLFYDTLKEIHAAWLLTPRDDLSGVCPREAALKRHDHLMRDLQDQCERWSLLGECPRGLDESSFAFRYGGFGTHELVQYYHLVRELLWSCWERLAELGKTQPATDGPGMFTVGDFLTSEVPRLESVREDWLDTPDLECHGRTPRSIICRERTRLPEGMSGHDAIVDPDCPCCQILADMPGPMFWHLDGSSMDDDFAFEIHLHTREEWETEQREREEHSKRFDAERAERKRLGVTDSGPGAPDRQTVWSSSFSVGDAADAPLGIRLFGIGGHLAELMVDIRDDADGFSASPEAQRFIDRLNRDFGNLRELLQNSEPSLAEALINPVIDRFAESLAAVASVRPDLSAKCESLTNSLVRFVDPRSPEPNWNADDSESPF